MPRIVNLAYVEPPKVEIPDRYPALTKDVYEQRLSRVRERLEVQGLDAIVIYADREHGGNYAYLAGFEPRFEESLLVVHSSGAPKALLGTENLGMVGYSLMN